MNELKRGILLKAGELYLKGGNRSFFIEKLISNIRNVTSAEFPELKIKEGTGKFLLTGYQHDPKLIDIITKIFGISVVEEVYICNSDPETIENAGLWLITNFSGFTSFRVLCKRNWKKFPVSSMEMASRVGKKIVDSLGMKVNLTSPEVTLKIVIDSSATFLSIFSKKGAGGLPVGVSGKGMLMISGGIDSPVAGWLAMKRGVEIECIHFHSPPYTGDGILRKVQNMVKILSMYSSPVRLSVCNVTPAWEYIREKIRNNYRIVMLRWTMLKIASTAGIQKGLDIVVTGENLGQVASQTLNNIYCIEKASLLPVMRPLIAFDKQEIIRLAKELGTFDFSTEEAMDCCSLFLPKHPVTHASIEVCRHYDSIFDSENIYSKCISTLTYI